MDAGWLKSPFSLKGKKVWVAGHTGLVGRALCDQLKNEQCQLVTISHAQLDLTRQAETQEWVEQAKPDAVFVAAAKTGGIQANMDEPAPFFYENTLIATNVIHACYQAGVEKLLYLGSSCVYPQIENRQIENSDLLSSPLEKSNEAYALSKIMGLKMCEYYRRQYECDYITVMPCNLYGPYDHFDDEKSHVIPALIKRLYNSIEAKSSQLKVWGDGMSYREFLHSADCARGLVHIMKHYSSVVPVNLGAGRDVRISELVNILKDISGFNGDILFDHKRPSGVRRKLMNSDPVMRSGWTPQYDLRSGLEHTYDWYIQNGA